MIQMIYRILTEKAFQQDNSPDALSYYGCFPFRYRDVFKPLSECPLGSPCISRFSFSESAETVL